jgi:hypothetical protein
MDEQWTEVGLATPDKGQKVLAWAADGESRVRYLMRGTCFNGRDFVFGPHGTRMHGVTHWMPLP